MIPIFKRQGTIKNEKNAYRESNKNIHWIMLVCILNWLMGILLPLAFWGAASEEDGYPSTPHYIFLTYSFFVVLFEIYIAFTTFPERVCSFLNCKCFCGFGWILKVMFLLGVGFLSRSDVYTDGIFLVVVSCTSDTVLFVPTIIVYVFGVIGFQCVCEGFSTLANLPELLGDMDSRPNEFTTFWMRWGDLNLVTEAFGVVSETDGAAHGIETMRETVATGCRFCCEDIGQTIIQILFLLEDHKGNGMDDRLVLASIGIAITLSAIKFSKAFYTCGHWVYRLCTGKTSILGDAEDFRDFPAEAVAMSKIPLPLDVKVDGALEEKAAHDKETKDGGGDEPVSKGLATDKVYLESGANSECLDG